MFHIFHADVFPQVAQAHYERSAYIIVFHFAYIMTSAKYKGAFFYSQFWNENGQNVKCAFFYSAFLFRNGQNAIPSLLLPGAE